jgi:hypothetical protein
MIDYEIKNFKITRKNIFEDALFTFYFSVVEVKNEENSKIYALCFSNVANAFYIKQLSINKPINSLTINDLTNNEVFLSKESNHPFQAIKEYIKNYPVSDFIEQI